MEYYKSNTELKNLARTQMRGRLGVLIGAMIIESLITSVTVYLVSAIIPTTTVIGAILNYIVTFIVQLLAFVLQVGSCLIYLRAACNMSCQISDLFYGFKNSPDKAIKIGFVLAVINAVCMLPCDIMQRNMLVFEVIDVNDLQQIIALYNTLASLYLVLFVCLIVYFIITLMFFPVFYMILDFPNYSASEILKKSIELMKGNKMRYVLLELSFLPLLLLSIFTCGIALLWVIPYMEMTNANFYLNLVVVKKQKGI